MTQNVAIVTVSYGSEEVLEGFLASVGAATDSAPIVIIADNKPLDGQPVRELADRFGARYLAMTGNVGYGSAMNAAVAVLPTDVRWVLVTNPDIELGVGSIDALVQVAESDESIGAVGPLVETDGVPYPSARSIPSLRSGTGHALFANLWPSNPWSRRYHADTELPPRERDAGWLSGSCLLVRRSAFEQVGGFDEGYFMYFEDVDLGYRLTKAGWRNRYAPSAVARHSGAHSTDGDSARMVRVHHASAYRFLSRKYDGWYLAPLRWAIRLGLAVRLTLVTRVFHRH